MRKHAVAKTALTMLVAGVFLSGIQIKAFTEGKSRMVAMEPMMIQMEIGQEQPETTNRSLPEQEAEARFLETDPAAKEEAKKRTEGISGNLKEITDFSEFKTQWKGLFTLPVGDTLLELYHFNEKKVNRYAKALNQFAEKLPEEIRLYSLLVPTQVGLTDDTYRDYSDPQERAIAYTYALLHPRYQAVDAFPLLYARREEYLYFRSDHHWTQLGAYYAAKAFAEKAGFFMRNKAEYKIHSQKGFLGYLYNKNMRKEVAANPDRIDLYTYPGENPKIRGYYYKEDGSIASENYPVVYTKGKAASYRAFLGGDFSLAVYAAPKKESGRNLLLVKDSYANAFVPWLTPYFDKIILVDPRHYRGNLYHLVKKEEITDFLVLDYIMATELEGFIAMLERLANAKP